MEILILGGTAFLSRAIARVALRRGHTVTCAARGSAPAPVDSTFVAVDRDDLQGLAPLCDRRWDAVIDVSRQPGQVRRAVTELSCQQYVFISTSNVYARCDRLEQAEGSEVVAPFVGDQLTDMSVYGAAKVACEEAVRTHPAATIIRSGLIGGPGDDSGRSGYYPWRFAHPTGPDVLVPGDLDFPTAMIDVDDLAEWAVTLVAGAVTGTFNATGPTTPLGTVLETARAVAESDLTITPVSTAALERAGVTAWMGTRSLPLWIDDPSWRYFATMDTTKAQAAGLVTRPLADTLKRALRYEEGRTIPRRAGLNDEDERLLRATLAQ